MDTDKKKYIIERLKKLESLIKENWEDQEDVLFPPDYFKILGLIQKIERGVEGEKLIEHLEQMNSIYKKNINIKKCGGLDKWKESGNGDWYEIDEFLKNHQKVKAIKSYRQKTGESLHTMKKVIDERYEKIMMSNESNK